MKVKIITWDNHEYIRETDDEEVKKMEDDGHLVIDLKEENMIFDFRKIRNDKETDN